MLGPYTILEVRMVIPAAPLPRGQSISGKVSWFGGPRDAETGSNRTATGTPSGAPGIAVYNRATLGGYWRVTAANGKSAVLKQTDLGPAPFTGRAIDVSSGALPKLGYSEENFPTGAEFKATYLGHSPAATSTPPPQAVQRETGLPGAPATTLTLNTKALQQAQQKAQADRTLLGMLGAGASDPLRLVMPTQEPNPASFDEAKAARLPGVSSNAASPKAPAGSAVAPEGQAKALSAAVTQLGTPYRWGGEEEHKGFDCSGLAQWAYRAAGISIPRTAQEQFDASTKTDKAQPGNLIFFGTSPSNVTHVEIVAGNGQMIGADHTGTSIRYEPLPQVGSRWGEDTVLAIGTPTGQPASSPPADAVVAQGTGSVIGTYKSPTGPKAIVHVASGPHAGKVAHVAGRLPVGHQFHPGDILGAPLSSSMGGL
jgi:cell wall-associated NlpC family hydrolase